MSVISRIEDLKCRSNNLKDSIELAQHVFGYIDNVEHVFIKIKIENKYVKLALPMEKYIPGEDLKELAIKAIVFGKVISISDK